jgi:DNA-binding MarR family transcriptional regulator
MPSQTDPKNHIAKRTGASYEALLLESQICFALYSTSLAMTKLYKPLLLPLGLTYPQYLVMLLMWEKDEQTVGALCERLVLDSGTLTPLLKRLEAQGLLSRERDARDERRVIVSLSIAGKTLGAKARRLPLQIAHSTGYSSDDVEQLISTLTTLRSNISNVDLA